MKLTKAFFEEVRKLILSARATVSSGVDLVQVHANTAEYVSDWI